jgi:autotransporter translocation and assembly factor TamB
MSKNTVGTWAIRGLLALAVVGSLAARKDPFEGKWKVKADPDQTGTAFSDTLTFKGGRMTAAVLSGKGWPAADVDEDVRQGGIAKFTCTLKNDAAGEQMKWQGQITASEISGTIVWVHKNKDEDHYSFTGSKN